MAELRTHALCFYVLLAGAACSGPQERLEATPPEATASAPASTHTAGGSTAPAAGDAGVSAGCPDDLAGAIGRSCERPGQRCEGVGCGLASARCNQIECVGGMWRRAQAPPPTP